MNIIKFSEELLGLTFQEFQKDIILQDKVRINSSRQMGFSMMSGIKMPYSAAFHPGRTIISVFPNMTMAQNSMAHIFELLQDTLIVVRSYDKGKIEFDNGSVIYFITPNSYKPEIFKSSVNEIYISDVNFIDSDKFNRMYWNLIHPLQDRISTFWTWSTKRYENEDPEKGPIDNLLKIPDIKYVSIPYYYKFDEAYKTINNLKGILSPEQLFMEYQIV